MNPEDALASAAATGNTELVRILIENGTDVNAVNSFGRTPLQYSNTTDTRLLHQSWRSGMPDIKSIPFLVDVMMMGSTTIARILLEYGAHPNIPDCHTGSTPLHDAARAGFVDTVAVLVHYHADINTMDNYGKRPIDLAQANGHQDVVAFLESV